MLHCFRRNAVKAFSTDSKSPYNIVSNRIVTAAASAIPSQQENETFTLDNGDTLSFSTCGASTASPLFFFHGQCGSRLQSLGFAESAKNLGLRIICPDRPGIGLTTFNSRRRLLDYPAQIAQLARHLGLQSYRVMGRSGGGPYALACAFDLPKTQLKGAAVLAGIGPPEDASFSQMRLGTRILFASLRYAPGLVGALADVLIGRMARDLSSEALRNAIVRQMKYLKPMLSPTELELFEKNQNIMDGIIMDIREHFRQGSEGFVRDGRLCVEPWGFRLEDIPFEGVRLYYGSKDINTPAQMGRNMAVKLKAAVFKEYEDETHMTLLGNHGEDILRDILEH